jgi:hypothetical protein
MAYKCPLCGSHLTEGHYHKVIKLQKRKDKAQQGELEKIRKQVALARTAVLAAKNKTRSAQAKAKLDVKIARKNAAEAEKRKTAIRNKRLMSRIRKLEDEKRMLKNHTSPQTIGLADEGVLVKKLKVEFPQDRIVHAGKGGDVLHYALFDGDEAGCIVYECKHTDQIAAAHITQTALAKKTRQANYGILVTTGTRKGFSGLAQESGIFLVAQAGVLTLARICRDSLITMAKQRLDVAAKAAAARRLMDYITSPTCKTPLEEAISHTERAHKNLQREVKQHLHDWKDRHELYMTIHYDITHVQKNIDRVLSGSEPLKLEKLKLEPLALPHK